MAGDILKYGILKCRDLVELYYGARMVTFIKQSEFSLSSSTPQTVILGRDPRRIAYELTLCSHPGVSTTMAIGTDAEIAAGQATIYDLGPSAPIIIPRSFLTYLDAVTAGLQALVSAGDVEVSLLEIILTPAPVDEVPLG